VQVQVLVLKSRVIWRFGISKSGHTDMSNTKATNQKGSKSSKLKDNNKSHQYKPIKRTLADNVYYLGSVKQASDYEATTEFLINYIKKTFTYGMDIGTVLETLQEIDLNLYKPSLGVSLSAEEGIRMAEDRQFEIESKAEYDAFTKRKQALEMNMSQA
jgi:exo-beta-1,3-glucanase (GH17 family)